jgi:PAS domain S-box-containing protein
MHLRLPSLHLLLVLLLAGFQAAASPATGLAGKQVLVLTSYGAGRPGVEVLLNGFTSALAGSGMDIDQVFTENLDLERAPDPEYRRRLAATLKQKYARRHFDALYVLEQPALDFLLRNLAGIARQAPVIVARANFPGQIERSGRRFVRQLVKYDVAGTIQCAMELFPKTRRVLFVAGSTPSDRVVAAQAALAMEPWQPAVAFEDTGSLTLDQVRLKLADPLPGTVIIVLPFDRDAAGRTAVQMEIAFMVAESAKAPVFTLWDNVVGRGAVGGSVTNFWDVGQQAGQCALDLMTGRTALIGSVTDLPSCAVPKFDWTQIERWGGDPGRLPRESVFINRPATLWHQYRRTVIVTSLFLLGQTLLIAVLLVQRRLRRLAQEALRDSEARSRVLVEEAPEAIVVYDHTENRLLDANANAERLFGCGREQLREGGLWPFYVEAQPDGRPPAETFAEHAVQAFAGEKTLFERNIRSADGSDHFCEVRLVPLPSADHHLLLRASFIDITERRRLEAERRELEAQLHQSQKLESLGSLAGGVAHDINNVLAAILSLASAHRQGMDPAAPLAKALDVIGSACVRGRDVVNRLLVFARKDLATVGPVDLNGVVREMVHLMEYTTLKRVRIATDFQEPLPAMEGDPAALGHALMNLFVNAVDAMPEGGELRITTRLLPGDQLQLSVRDTGHGMSPEVLKKAVEPFFTTKPMGKGTGLGLAMVFGTVKTHKGTLDLRSAPGEGTEAVLTFPACRPSPAPELPPGGSNGPGSGQPLRILLVDDDELILLSVAPMLTVLGHQVQTAASGQEALARLEAGLEVDLVILDMNMPGLDGAQTLARLKALRPEQRVLMASGYSDQDIAPLMAAHARVASIQKPFDLGEIAKKLAAMAGAGA